MNQHKFKDVLFVCGILQKHNVEFLIVGGFAVSFYGYSRMTTDAQGNILSKEDFDIWYNPTYSNYYSLLNALKDFGLNVTEYKKEQTPNPHKSFFKLNLTDFTLDFLPSIIGLEKFRDSFEKRQTFKIEDTEIMFLSFEDLLKNKLRTGRPKDLKDIEELNKVNNK